MGDFNVGLIIGITFGCLTGAALFSPAKDKLKDQQALQKQCLFPVLSKSFLAEPFTKTCFYIQGTNKTVIDCKTVLFLPEFVDVKGCF